MSKPWSYCPECGSEETQYEEGDHKQCANCHQEWFSDIDYSDVVRKHLSGQHSDKDAVIERLRAELAALKSGQGEAVAPYGYLREVDGNVQLSIGPARPADRSEGCATPWAAIFAEPPTTAGAVSVPRELLERAIANLALLDSRPRSMCRDCADCSGVCHTTGLDCDVSALTAGLRALLAQSQEVKS